MNNQNQDFYQTDLIVRYLSNQMSEPEKSAFQSRLLFDSELRREVSELRTVKKAYVASTLATKPAPRSFGSVWGWVAAGVSVFAVVANLYFQSGESSQPEPTPVAPTVQPTIPVAPATSGEPVAAVQGDVKNQPVAVAKSPQSAVKKPVDDNNLMPSVTEDSEQSEAIAYNEDDFKENVYLEEWHIGRRTRQSVVLIPPDQNFKFARADGKINFALKGTFKGDRKLLIDVYSNKQEDFQAGKVLWNDEVPVGADGSFSFSEVITFKPGLYYYVLGHSDEPIIVGRIEVR